MFTLDESLRNSKVVGWLFSWLEEITGSSLAAMIIFFVIIGLLLLSIILLIVLLIKNGKKKRALKAARELGFDLKEADKKEEVKENKVEEPKEEKVEKVEVAKEEVKDNKTEKVANKVQERKVPETNTKQIEEVASTPTSTLKKPGKFEIFPVGSYFIYRLKASNGENLVTSELYTSLKGARGAIETVIKNLSEGQLQITKDKHNLYQFKLFGGNKRLLVVSANYSTQKNCENAANSFKNFAPISPIVELKEDPQHLFEEIDLGTKSPKEKGKFVISGEGKIYDFKLLASNGATICSSIEFSSKDGALKGIDTLKEAIKNGKFFVVKDKNNQYQFKLYSSSGRAVAYGEVYGSKTSAIEAAKSVNNFVDGASIVE